MAVGFVDVEVGVVVDVGVVVRDRVVVGTCATVGVPVGVLATDAVAQLVGAGLDDFAGDGVVVVAGTVTVTVLVLGFGAVVVVVAGTITVTVTVDGRGVVVQLGTTTVTVDGLLHGSGSGCIEMPPVIEKLGNAHGLEVAVTVVVLVSVTVLVSVVSVALVMGSAEAVSVTVTVSGAIGPAPSTDAFGSAAGGGASVGVSATTLVVLDSSATVLVMLPCSSCERSPKFCVPEEVPAAPNPSLPDLFPIAIAPPADATITTAATAAYGRCLRASPVVTYSVTRRHVRTNGDATS
ncbi:hypothetical protein [Nocardia altamirensis]|uniref:hypothetical protein n=1 Tax=Nocardia altamirensis TaxID=472158 RepID=UPI0008400E47|nr:hypothetical protein [Nocardia altamirensis]